MAPSDLVAHTFNKFESFIVTESTTTTALDHYIGLFDRAVHEALAFKEMLSLFAPEATVELGLEPVRGIEAITDFYRDFCATIADSKHFWKTTVLDDGTLQAEWVAAAHMADNSLMSSAGVEYATIDSAGRITHLRNELTH